MQVAGFDGAPARLDGVEVRVGVRVGVPDDDPWARDVDGAAEVVEVDGVG
ncbi:hypothetical protein [Allobranchiibius huperziae]|uniref:Uncharacterized protein n=1 Tax=Allobranchiibius huperziae TaxID=1874116 RepID=A0A853DFU6_9MICO|nr:hypothetical protein [Allobranchiibius huperziae]NYJ73761.1 hypothetical protein [Allobranchiibius huperziae]